MKIAFPTDDGKTISPHFGRAPYYLIAVLEEGSEPRFEQREKSYHGSEEHGHHDEHEHNHHRDHSDMFAPLSDCQVLIAGGMGSPAHDHALSMGLQVLLPAEKNIQNALAMFQRGELKSDPRRIHNHGQGNIHLA